MCETGKVKRKRKGEAVEVTDPDATAKQNLIEQAYQVGESLDLIVLTADQAGPFQTRPYLGNSWGPEVNPNLDKPESESADLAKKSAKSADK